MTPPYGIPSCAVTPAQLLFLIIAYLRAAGWLGPRPKPDEDPENPGFVNIAGAQAAAIAYINAKPIPEMEKFAQINAVNQACGQASMGFLNLAVQS